MTEIIKKNPSRHNNNAFMLYLLEPGLICLGMHSGMKRNDSFGNKRRQEIHLFMEED